MAVTMEDVQTLVGVQLGIRKVWAEHRFMEDLGAESADLLNIIAAAEVKYNISFDETDISKIRTVQELHDFIVKR